jgi:hypothetical protein
MPLADQNVTRASWGRVRRAKVTSPKVTFSLGNVQLDLDDQVIFDAIAPQLMAGLEKLGKSVEEVARARAPIGKAPSAKPHVANLQPIRLRPMSAFPPGPDATFTTGEKMSAKQRLHLQHNEMHEQGRITAMGKLAAHGGSVGTKVGSRSALLKHYQGTKKFGTRGVSPTHIRLVGNTMMGAFQHRPGTLKRSIHFTGVERVGNTLTATVVADAPYALYVHEGFTLQGGKDHSGKGTMIAGRPFLKSALINVMGRLSDSSTYKG